MLHLQLASGGNELQAQADHDKAGRPINPGFVAQVCTPWPGRRQHCGDDGIPASLDGNTRRAIDFHEGEKIDEEALKALVRAAVTLNASRAHG